MHYDNMEYHTAALQYSNYLKRKKDNTSQIKLAECYLHMNHFAEAEKEYAQVVSFPEITVKNQLEYAHILKHNGKYNMARKWYVKYLLYNPTDVAVTSELRSCDSLMNYTRYSYQYEVSPAYVSPDASNFSPVFYKNGIVFCSEHSKPSSVSEISKWTGHTYLDLHFAKMFTTTEEVNPGISSDIKTVLAHSGGPHNNEIIKPEKMLESFPFAMEINSVYNEGPACFSKDEKTIYFTRNILDKKNKPEKNKANINNVEIYQSVFEEWKWSQPKLLNFDNKEYSVGHPALSKNEKRLYFISDKPGGMGGTDLYYSNLKDGIWSEPINLGAEINTSENEMFPTIVTDTKENEYLYFSSEGMDGMGGLDIYYSRISDSSFEKPVHLGAPLNSSADDFGIIFEVNGLNGFLSSNRDDVNGKDNIYYFKKYVPEFYLEITLKKKGTGEIIPKATVDLNYLLNNTQETLTTDEKGKILKKLEPNTKVEVTGKKDNFFTASARANNIGKIFSDTIHLTLELEAIVINKAIRLENIYYDYDKWDIRPDAMPELDKLVTVMKENPEIFIELSSHTDSRGGDNFNMKLSQKRAESAVNYIIDKGVAMERITAKGYGESKPLNKCGNKDKCNEEEYQLNRRTEFKVVKVSGMTPNTY